MSQLTMQQRELVAIGASLASNCIPCVKFHVRKGREVGLTAEVIREAVEVADTVRQVPARKVLEVATAVLASDRTPSEKAKGKSTCGGGDEERLSKGHSWFTLLWSGGRTMNKQKPPDTPFEEVIEDLGPTLRSYLGRKVGDPELADDLFQETSIKIARGLPGFEGRSTIRTWAFQIAHRVCIDHFRKSSSKQTVLEFLEADHPAQEPEHDEAIVIDEMNQCIRDVIDSLPPDYRTALVLHDLEGLTGDEVARVSECSLTTAKIRIHRARKRVRAALQDQCQFYHDRDQVLRCDRKEPEGSDD